MNNKILTISVAAYNVEQYIHNTIESLCAKDIIDNLEVFIIDDGGKDNTFKIAKEFESMYPSSIHVIHKENGGYGSTVNYSISHATGRFFKLLDGDDWYDTNGLVKLVNHLAQTDADIVITNYMTGSNRDAMKMHNYFAEEGKGIKRLDGFSPRNCFGMWPMTIKTSVLQHSNLILPEHELYTDQFFCTYPLAMARTIEYIDCSVYCYRTDRNGQSTSKGARIKHYKETLNHAIELTKFCALQKGEPNYPIVLKRVSGYHSGAINALLLKPINKDNLKEIKEYEKYIRSISEDVFNDAVKSGETGKLLWLMRKTGYVIYWMLKPIHNMI